MSEVQDRTGSTRDSHISTERVQRYRFGQARLTAMFAGATAAAAGSVGD